MGNSWLVHTTTDSWSCLQGVLPLFYPLTGTLKLTKPKETHLHDPQHNNSTPFTSGHRILPSPPVQSLHSASGEANKHSCPMISQGSLPQNKAKSPGVARPLRQMLYPDFYNPKVKHSNDSDLWNALWTRKTVGPSSASIESYRPTNSVGPEVIIPFWQATEKWVSCTSSS